MAFVPARSTRADFIGRERELEELAIHRRAAADGHGRIVLLGGEAGIGKSRLLRQFEGTVAGTRAISAQSRCVEFVQTPLAPLRNLLQQLERRSNAVPDPATRALIERLAFDVRSEETIPGWLPEGALFDSIDNAVGRYALNGTLVLTIEDLHWSDRSTFAFLTYLADQVEKRRILIVATYRVDEVGSKHPRLPEFSALLSKPATSAIRLAPLGESEIRTILGQAAGDRRQISSATAAEIVRRAQGNPFFAKELIKSAIEASEGRGEELPLSIRASVLARAAQLSDEDRDIISLAAVLGQRSSVDELVAISSAEREKVLRALERARALRLLYDEAAKPGEVAFRHALTQEVLYSELLAERVRPLHEAIASELERRADRNAKTVELAHHWRRAGALEKAAAYDELAADRAFAIGAFADAILYYERALRVRDNDPGLLHKLGVTLGAINELRSAIENLRRAGILYWQAGNFEEFAENASSLVAQLYNSGDVAAATAACHDAIATLGGKVAAEKLNMFRTRLAFQCIAALDDKSAEAFLNEIPEPIEDSRVAMHADWNRFRIAAMRGEIEEWRTLTARSLGAAEQQDDGGSWVRFLHCQAALDAVGLGEIELARDHFRFATPSRLERESVQSTLLGAASALEHTLRGDFAAAARLLRDVGASAQNYAILVHAKSAKFVLGICSGDDARLKHDDTESFLRYGIDRDMKVAIGLLGGPYAWALGLRGELKDAAGWIHRIAPALPTAHRFFFAYLAAAQFGVPGDVLAMREILAKAAAHPQDRVNKAVLALFDAYAGTRGVVEADVRASALASAAGFESIGWPWLAAQGYEVGGESRRALEIHRSLGSLHDVRRLQSAISGASASGLSSRELEVAQLVAKGHSNEEIAQILHISSRTAEKHVSSALKKLNLRSRVQLGGALARSQIDL